MARGDYNVHSDIDVLVISDDLPPHPLERAEFLYRLAPPRVEPKGYTTREWRSMQRRRNPIALEVSAGNRVKL